MSEKRVVCPHCEKSVGVNVNGNVRRHGSVATAECQGGGRPAACMEDAPVADRTEKNDAVFRRVMDGHNKTVQGLIDKATDLALKHRCGLASFGAALHAYRDAALFADEGPGDPLTADQWEDIENVRRTLPDWATR